MNNLSIDQTIRFSKATLMLFMTLFGLLINYNNFADYSTNYEFLAHILSMDTTPADPKYAFRAITSPMAHHRIYWLLITLEVLFTCCCMIGTYHLFKNLNNSAKKFHEAKKFAIIGLTIIIFVYYICFQVIGIEWFNMDKSPQWNYKDWAQYVIDFILPVLIYVAIRTER